MDLPFPEEVTEWNWETIQDIQGRSEGQYLEFKKILHAGENNDPREWQLTLERELAAFANASGGVLVFGISDDGDVKGFELPDHEVEQSIARLVQNTTPLLDFDLSPTIEIPSENTNRVLLAVYVSEAHRKPIRCSDGSIYIRVNNQKHPMSREQMESLFVENDRRQQAVRQLEMEIRRFRDAIASPQDILQIHGHSPPDFHMINTESLSDVLRKNTRLYADEEIQSKISRVFEAIREIRHQEVYFGRLAKGYVENDGYYNSQSDMYESERGNFRGNIKRLNQRLIGLVEAADLAVDLNEIDR